MKQLIVVLISIGCALFSSAQDQPKAVAELVSKRDAARSKANEAFMVKVVKLQSTYSKNGDVESAKKLAALINDSAGKDFKSYPSAARGFVATRDKDFKRINEIFIRELVKLQSKYTASSDFENAKKVAALITDFGGGSNVPETLPESATELRGWLTKKTFEFDHKIGRHFINVYKEKTTLRIASQEPKEIGLKAKSKREVEVKFPAGTTYKIRFNSQMTDAILLAPWGERFSLIIKS
ncbi:MAG: hypothetical protein ACON4R_00540 [Akkermansiaceae bacterium]